VYVAYPADDRGLRAVPAQPSAVVQSVWGVFIHVEIDQNTGRPEARFVIDSDGTWDGLRSSLVHLDALTLGASAREQRNVHVPELPGEDPVEALRLRVLAVWPALLAMIEPGVVYRRSDLPGEVARRPVPERSPGGTIKWPRAKARSTWVSSTDPAVSASLRSV
jgi:hypothetical protein